MSNKKRARICRAKNALTWVAGILVAAICTFYSVDYCTYIAQMVEKYLDSSRSLAGILGFSIIPALILWTCIKAVKQTNKNRTATYKMYDEVAKYGEQYQTAYIKRSARQRLINTLSYIIAILVSFVFTMLLLNSDFSRSTDGSKLILIKMIPLVLSIAVVYQLNKGRIEDFNERENHIRETIKEVGADDKTES